MLMATVSLRADGRIVDDARLLRRLAGERVEQHKAPSVQSGSCGVAWHIGVWYRSPCRGSPGGKEGIARGNIFWRLTALHTMVCHGLTRHLAR
jgi:hypothetical protein